MGLEWIPSDIFCLMLVVFLLLRICIHTNCVYNHSHANKTTFRAFLTTVKRTIAYELPIFHNVLSLILQLIKSDMFGSQNSGSQCSEREIKIPISRHRHQKKDCSTASRLASKFHWHFIRKTENVTS